MVWWPGDRRALLRAPNSQEGNEWQVSREAVNRTPIGLENIEKPGERLWAKRAINTERAPIGHDDLLIKKKKVRRAGKRALSGQVNAD